MSKASTANDSTAAWSNVNLTSGDSNGRVRLQSARNPDAWIEADVESVVAAKAER